MSRATDELLATLHGEVATELLRRIRSGEATPADIAQAIKLLKDNNITALPAAGSPLGSLVEGLPFPAEGEQDITTLN